MANPCVLGCRGSVFCSSWIWGVKHQESMQPPFKHRISSINNNRAFHERILLHNMQGAGNRMDRYVIVVKTNKKLWKKNKKSSANLIVFCICQKNYLIRLHKFIVVMPECDISKMLDEASLFVCSKWQHRICEYEIQPARSTIFAESANLESCKCKKRPRGTAENMGKNFRDTSTYYQFVR